MIPVMLALSASLGWGSADFLGGLQSRRLRVLTVLVVSHTAGLLVLAFFLLATKSAPPGTDFVSYAVLSAVAQTIGIGAYYRALSTGPMGVVAPISAMAAIVPVAVGTASGEELTFFQAIGIAFAIIGVVLASRTGSAGAGKGSVAAGVGMALLAALGIGSFFVAIDLAADRGNFVWAVFVNRIVAVLILVALALAVRQRVPFTLWSLGTLTAIGVLVVAATLLFAAATTRGLISIVSVIAALYPLTTILLARLLLRERIRAIQRFGGLVALTGVGLIVVS